MIDRDGLDHDAELRRLSPQSLTLSLSLWPSYKRCDYTALRLWALWYDRICGLSKWLSRRTHDCDHGL